MLIFFLLSSVNNVLKKIRLFFVTAAATAADNFLKFFFHFMTDIYIRYLPVLFWGGLWGNNFFLLSPKVRLSIGSWSLDRYLLYKVSSY